MLSDKVLHKACLFTSLNKVSSAGNNGVQVYSIFQTCIHYDLLLEQNIVPVCNYKFYSQPSLQTIPLGHSKHLIRVM